MKKTILLLFTCFIYSSSFAQLEKGNWLVGGSGSFSSATEQDDNPNGKTIRVDLSSSTGYFAFDKIVFGASLGYSYENLSEHGDPNSLENIYHAYNFGPYMRYYFLDINKPINLFLQSGYNWGIERGELFLKTLTFKGGPVIFLNDNVGLEFSLGYSSIKNRDYPQYFNAFETGIALQIHLKK